MSDEEPPLTAYPELALLARQNKNTPLEMRAVVYLEGDDYKPARFRSKGYFLDVSGQEPVLTFKLFRSGAVVSLPLCRHDNPNDYFLLKENQDDLTDEEFAERRAQILARQAIKVTNCVTGTVLYHNRELEKNLEAYVLRSRNKRR